MRLVTGKSLEESNGKADRWKRKIAKMTVRRKVITCCVNELVFNNETLSSQGSSRRDGESSFSF